MAAASLSLDADDSEVSRLCRFRSVLGSSPLDVALLRRLSWSGVPMRVRAAVWRVLSLQLHDEDVGMSSSSSLPLGDFFEVLRRQRRRYWAWAEAAKVNTPVEALRQVRMDLPRMARDFPLVGEPRVRRCVERVLLVWAYTHPDTGYVQGMNDILAPVIAVLMLEDTLTGGIPPSRDLEADAHACLARLLGGVRDFYTAGRPGVKRAVQRLETLVARVDGALHSHLRSHGVDYMLLAFRWLNNLLTRELPPRCHARLWDTLLADQAPQDLLVYLSAAFLRRWRPLLLKEKDFSGLVMALQRLPTQRWGGRDVDALLAEAYRLQAAFQDSPSHLGSS